jgi:hypothetical protein
MSRRWGVPAFAVAAVIALTSMLVGPAASAAPPAGVNMQGTGPAPPGVGLFSKAALAQAHCAKNGQTWSTYEGGGPWCVNPWPAGKKNGGATAQGVTATQVKVIAYVPNDQMIAASTSPKPMDQATKQQATVAAAFKDLEEAYAYAAEHNGTYQLWGRKPEIELFTATGSDEAAQRADAVAVIAKKPFMVVDATSTTAGAPVFSTTVANSKIIVASASTDSKAGTNQAPYRWNTTNDPSSLPVVTAAFIGKSLSGKKAQWAGDTALAGKTRAFGAVYPTSGVDFAAFERLLTQDGGKLTEQLSYDPAAAQTGSVDFSPLITRLKSSGVTSVILFTPRDVVKSLMSLATSQEYFPEWIYTGVQFHEYMALARTNDPKQMAHAFGLAQIGPYLTNDPRITIPDWYWGTSQGATWPGALGPLEFVYTAMHYAGPDLTAKNVQKGLFAAPAQTIPKVAIGLWGYGKTVGTPYNAVGANGSDRALIWWDPDTEGQALATPLGKGVWQYLDNGENVSYQNFTKTEPKFFDKKVSVTQRNALDYYPGGVAPTQIPCDQCPKNGGTPS